MMKMHSTNYLLLFVGLACFSQDVLGAHDLSEEYHFSVALAGEDYVLYWTANLPSNEIRFAVNVSTTGWVGFGLSPNGQMPGSDVVIGWVDNSSKVMFHDRHAEDRFLPAIDDSQDWFLTSGLEENGRTILEFKRSLTTCDEYDMDIKADTARIIWSYNSRDPSSPEELGKLQHTRQGSASLNLLGGLQKERVEENSDSFKVLNDNVTIPSHKDTTYWCTVHELPQELQQQERYVYKFSPVFFKTTEKYVHHILAYLCSNINGSHVGTSQECNEGGIHIDIALCRDTGVLFAAWAVGGTEFVFPDGVSFPFGGKGQEYIVLESHYDNPGLVSGLVDNTGMKFDYVNEEPENRAGVLTLGQKVSSSMVIPPRADNFIVNALLPGQCTEKFFPEEGIKVFGNILHTHLAGHGLIVRHLRETSTCGGLEELQPLDENRKYDFNYQQITHLPKVVQVLPGDILHLECFYRTTDSAYQTVTLGGESTREEMCFSLLYYYPEIELTYSVGNQTVSHEFTSQHLDPDTEAALFSSLEDNNRTEVMSIFNQVEWNSQTVDSFQSSVHSSTYFTSCINATGDGSTLGTENDLPKADCPYKPPIKSCPNVSGSSSLHYYTSLTLLLTMLSFVAQL